VSDFAEALEAALTAGRSGLLHLGSSNSISKYEFARIVMETYNSDMSLLSPITVDDLELKANRARDTSLNVNLLESIWYRPAQTVAEGVKRTAV